MQKILSFYIFKYLLLQSAHRQTGLIAGKLSDSTNNEKLDNGRMITENSASIYQRLGDYRLKGLNEFKRVVHLKWSARIEDMFYHSPFGSTTQHYMQNRNLNYLLLYCANTELSEGKGYTN